MIDGYKNALGIELIEKHIKSGLDYNQPLCLTSVNAWKVVSRSVHIFYFQSSSFLFHEYAQEYSCGV
jgi:hypothetical protein